MMRIKKKIMLGIETMVGDLRSQRSVRGEELLGKSQWHN